MSEITHPDGWLKIDKNSGVDGDNITAIVLYTNPGREPRVAVLNGELTGDYSASAQATFTQAGVTEFVQFTNKGAYHSVTVSAETTSVVLEGKSNSSKLTFVLNSTSPYVDYINSITNASFVAIKNALNQQNVVNGTALNPDYGAEAEYDFKLTITFSANTGASARTERVDAYCNDPTKTDYCEVTQLGVEAALLFDGSANASYNAADRSHVITVTTSPSGESWSLSWQTNNA
jgi:hypothetical protein